MHPEWGSIRPWDKGAIRWGQTSDITDHSVVFGFFHTTNLSLLTMMDWGKSVGILDMLQIGSHAPCSDIWSIGLRNEDVDLVLTINADVMDIHNDMDNRSMTRSNIVTKTRIFSGIFAVFVLACSLYLSKNCWFCKKITRDLLGNGENWHDERFWMHHHSALLKKLQLVRVYQHV